MFDMQSESLVNRKVMLLGAAQGEVPLLKAYQKLGCFVVVVGKGSHYPCCKLADRFYDIDLMDYDAVMKIAREERITAVSSNTLEFTIPLGAWIAESLNIEGIGAETALDFTNKYRMRNAAKKVGVAVPEYTSCESIDDAVSFAMRVGFPLIMKPVDNCASRGVIKVESLSELRDQFSNSIKESLSAKKVIVERFITGIEYNVDAFTHNYQCDNLDVAFKDTVRCNGFCVPMSYIIQDADSCQTSIEQRLLQENKKLVEGMKLKFGITHANYIYCPGDDKIYLVEIAARGGGDGISEFMIELATGCDVNLLLALYSMGIDVLGGNSLHLREGAAAWYGFELPEGVIETVYGLEDVKRLPGVYGVLDSTFEVGKKVEKLVDLTKKFGPVWCYGANRLECDRIFNNVKKLLKIDVKKADGSYGGIKW